MDEEELQLKEKDAFPISLRPGLVSISLDKVMRDNNHVVITTYVKYRTTRGEKNLHFENIMKRE